MSASWLTEVWVAAAAAEVADTTWPPSLNCTVVVEVTGGVDGDVAIHGRFAGGSLVAGGFGPTDAPDLTLTVSDADARAVLTGALEPAVAFMQGRMKVTGDMAALLDLLAASGTDDARARRARIGALADL